METFKHSGLASPFFRQVEVLEVDVLLGDESWTWRLEIFQALDRDNCYRYRAWELEFFRLRPTFPQDEDGEPLHRCDDPQWVQRSLPRESVSSEGFTAMSVAEATDIALRDLRSSLEHISDEGVEV